MRFLPPRSAWTTGLGTTLAFGNWGALPWVIGALVEGAGFKPDAAAFLGTVELSLMGGVMLILAPMMPRLNRMHLVAVALPVVVLAQLVTAYLHAYYLMMAVRGLSGVAFGVLFAVATAEGADTAEPESTFAMSTVITMGCGIFKSLLLGFAKQHYGYQGIFIALTGYYSVVGLPLLLLLIGAPPRPAALALQPVRVVPPLTLVIGVLTVMSMFSISTSGVYAFVERVADHVGISATTLGRGFAVSALIGTLGGVAASRLGLKLGRIVPTMGSFVLLGLLSWQVMHSGSNVAFFAAYPCWVIMHWFCYSYVMGLSVLVDPLGRLATITSATYILTGAAGAGVAGLFTRYAGLSSFGWGALGICVVGALASWAVLALQRQSQSRTALAESVVL